MSHDPTLSRFVLQGRWRFQQVIGRGADGTVYLAKDERAGTPVAVKVYDSLIGKHGARVREKIAEEAQVARAVTSPHLVQVLDWGVAPAEGGAEAGFIVMEYLEGEPLRDVLERRRAPMPLDDVVRILRGVLRAVASLHDNGYLHRDLKPENVFVLRQPQGEVAVKLFDLGAIRSVEQAHVGAARGTPLYVAPEVARRAGRIGRQSDVYSTGVMLYELLVGRPPVADHATPAQIVAQHVYGQLDALPPEWSAAAIGDVYRRATARDPSRRYRDASAFERALGQLAPAANQLLPSPSAFSSTVTEDSVVGALPPFVSPGS